MDEFDLIARHFAPLATNPAACGLGDDLAWLSPPPGFDLVAKTDAVAADVHFFAADPPGLIARKALRRALSDLAGKGAEPLGYLLAAQFPRDTTDSWLADFAAGLAADQAEFGLSLLGGDTTATPGPLTLSVTALGLVPAGQRRLRADARDGDLLFVSGTIGDAALGLRALQNGLRQTGLIDRYHLPRPRLALGQALRPLIHAAIDVSDGLASDAGHICRQSGLAAVIGRAAVPLSPAAQRELAADPALWPLILGGGDDYELLFTAAPQARAAIAAAAAQCGVAVAEIGRMTAGQGVTVLDEQGQPFHIARTGYRHF